MSLIAPVICIFDVPSLFDSLMEGMVVIVASLPVFFFLPLAAPPFRLEVTPDFCFLSLSAAAFSAFFLAAAFSFFSLMALYLYRQE
jgi:hypothetical protein